jgi:hypothetical protein
MRLNEEIRDTGACIKRSRQTIRSVRSTFAEVQYNRYLGQTVRQGLWLAQLIEATEKAVGAYSSSLGQSQNLAGITRKPFQSELAWQLAPRHPPDPRIV